MTTDKTIWFTAGLFCLSLLFACGPGTPPAPAEPREPDGELVPGLDIWARERARPPQWELKEDLSADYLSRAERHREFMQAGVPVEYRHRGNPYPAETGSIREGGRLYRANCEACHGAGGLGDGVAARDLTPPPAFLSFLIERPRAADQYLLWTIAEGGARFGTEMPAYKDRLTESEIWQIISWMRAGFPEIGGWAGVPAMLSRPAGWPWDRAAYLRCAALWRWPAPPRMHQTTAVTQAPRMAG